MSVGATEPAGMMQPLEVSGEVDATLISRIFDIIAEFRPLYDTATAISSIMCGSFGYLSCAILLRRGGQDILEIEGAAGLSSSYIEAVNSGYPIRIQDPMLSEGPTSEAFRTNRPVSIYDTDADVRFRRWRELARQQGYRSMISVPMSVDDTVIGALNCYHANPHEFSVSETRTLMTVATQVGLAIEIGRMVHEQQSTIVRLNELTSELEQQRQLLEQSEEIHERLTRLVLMNQGIPAIVSALAEIVGGPVVVHDCFFEPIVSVAPDGDDTAIGMPPIEGLTRQNANQNSSTVVQIPPHAAGAPAWLMAQVVAGREVLGYVSVAISELPAPALTRRAIGHAATVIALEMVKERLTHEMDVRDRRTYTDDLLSGRFDDAARMRIRGRHLGCDLRGPFQVIVFDVGRFRHSLRGNGRVNADEEALRRRFYDIVVQFAHDSASNRLISAKDDRLSIILTRLDAEGKDVAEVDRAVRALLAKALPNLPVSAGVGRVAETLEEIPRSFREAGKALQAIGQLGGAGRTLAFEELGVAGILLQAGDTSDLIRFARSRLGPVVEYDRQHGGILLEALNAYLGAGLAVPVAAEAMNVHPNTVRYRLRKIESLIGASLRDQSLLLDLNLAHKILQLAGDYETVTSLSPTE